MANAYTFLAKYYDKFISQNCDYVSWSQYLLSKAAERNARTAIDIACGTGKMTRLLANGGLTVIASDASREMLNEAVGTCNATFVLQDMRCLQMLRQMDMAVCVNDGVNYLRPDELPAFFKRVYANLKFGAPFIFDVSSEYKLRTVIGGNVFYYDYNEATLLWTNKLTNNSVTMDITVFERQNGLYKRYDESHVQYVHAQADIEQALQQAGFTVKEVTADYGKPLKPDSHRITFYAVK